MAGKMVEMTFAIGATLAGSFTNAFGKAGQVLGEMQKQSQELQQVSGQVDGFQKLQESITKNQEAMQQAQAQAKALEGQIISSKQATAALKGQCGEAQSQKGADADKAMTAALKQVHGNAKEAQKAAKSFGVRLVADNGKMRPL